MRRPRRNEAETALFLLALFLRLPMVLRIVIAVVVLVGGLVYLVAQSWPRHHGPTPAPDTNAPSPTSPAGPGRYLFCFWNVENLFDDVNDKRRPTDEEYDNPFADDAHLRQLKYDHISSALVKMNGGRGPDIIACVEMESTRAAELLRAALNAKLADPALYYTNLEMKDLDAGRHIAPCLLTRLPVDSARTRLRGSKVRILETHVRVNGNDLCAVVSHWTSQLTDKTSGSETDTGRGKYASIIHEMFMDATRDNPAADFLVCGDFNDTPDSDAVVQVLHATGDRAKVTSHEPTGYLLDLLAGKPADSFGTIWYRGKPLIYDHICVSAGMLDGKGWTCDPNTIHVASEGLTAPGSTRREPWRFRNPLPPVPDDARGYSDHFPVTVELSVAP